MIRDFLRRVLALIRKEFIVTWMDPKIRLIIIAMPIMQLVIFANAVTMEVRNIDVAVIDRSNSVESRELLSRFEHSPRFRNFYYTDNENTFQKYIDIQRAQIGIQINNDFAKNLKSNRGATVQIITDGRQTNSASIAGGYAAQIIADYGAEGVTKGGASIRTNVRNRYNDNLNYQWFILTVIVAMLSLIITLILTALSVSRERELGTFDQLIVSPLSSVEILIGKAVPPLIISLLLTVAMISMIIVFFGMPLRGSVILLLVSVFISLLSIVGIGLYLSSISNTQQQAIIVCMIFMMPAVLLAGYISPIEDMPQFLQYLTYLNPVRFFVFLTRSIFLKGMGINDIIIDVIPLIIIACITLSLAGRTFKRKLG